jgi:hypothetical protein
MQKWSPAIKKQALSLRKSGLSYINISRELNVPPSTINSWVNPPNPNSLSSFDKIQWMKKVQIIGAHGSHLRRQIILADIKSRVNSQVANIDSQDITTKKIIVASLYWAEGAKGKTDGMNFANTDPLLMLFFTTLFRHCYHPEESRLRLRLHLHHYHHQKRVEQFWSELLSIPLNQFNKTYLKQRSPNRQFRRNLAGICFLKYNSRHLKEEILEFGRQTAQKYTGTVKLPEHHKLRL